MERIHIPYSLRNIPRCSSQDYLKSLISRTSDFIGRLRWKAHFFLQGDNAIQNEKETFGFRTNLSPPFVRELKAFEDDLHELMASVKFRRKPNDFLDKLDKDVRAIQTSTEPVIPSDKTGNFYKLPVSDYQRLIEKSITAEYRKAPANTVAQIDEQAIPIVNRLQLEGRVEKFESSGAFVLLKDHKPNFSTNLPCRLINPAKSDIGKISKIFLDRINTDIRNKTGLNQWKSTGDVLSWFNATKSSQIRFLQFDIESFYPSISEELLSRVLNWAQSIVQIPDDNIEVILLSRNSPIISPKGETWQRKDSLFDVGMGANDGAEVCELVGLYLLHRIGEFHPSSHHGLYRDDGLMMVEGMSKRQMERIRKDIYWLFQEENLGVVVSPPLDSANFLDITLRRDGSHCPYRKPEKLTEYVHIHSNHLPAVLKNIPSMVENRINCLSSSEKVFNSAKIYYEEALDRSGFSNSILTYRQPSGPGMQTHKKKKRRRRNILWYNPPYSVTVDTNIGQNFLQLIDKHFPQGHKLHKILNRNCVKVSYCTMRNMERILKSHNKKILQQHSQSAPPSTNDCNCRRGTPCPLQGKCQASGVVYLATLRAGTEEFHYVGMTERAFKKRFYEHTSTFNHRGNGDNPDRHTSLSRKVWDFKDRKLLYTLTWKILRRGYSFRPGQKSCDLCLSEKLEILKRSSDNRLLNTRSELLRKCNHRWKHLVVPK